MKGLSHVLAILGGLLFAMAVAGRFYSLPTITMAGQSYAASTFLLLSIAVLLAALYLRPWPVTK